MFLTKEQLIREFKADTKLFKWGKRRYPRELAKQVVFFLEGLSFYGVKGLDYFYYHKDEGYISFTWTLRDNSKIIGVKVYEDHFYGVYKEFGDNGKMLIDGVTPKDIEAICCVDQQ